MTPPRTHDTTTTKHKQNGSTFMKNTAWRLYDIQTWLRKRVLRFPGAYLSEDTGVILTHWNRDKVAHILLETF